jgi:hypothetical protein
MGGVVAARAVWVVGPKKAGAKAVVKIPSIVAARTRHNPRPAPLAIDLNLEAFFTVVIFSIVSRQSVTIKPLSL